MIRQAKLLGQATAQLIQSIKGEAEKQDDSEMQRKLLAAAKQLADATARMVEAARLCASNPHDSVHQETLRVAAEELRVITTTTAHTPAMKRKLINRLEQCSKQAASAATQCITAAQNSMVHSNDVQTKGTLLQDCQGVADQIPRLVAGVKNTLSHPDDPHAHLALINAAEMFLEPANHVATSARGKLSKERAFIYVRIELDTLPLKILAPLNCSTAKTIFFENRHLRLAFCQIKWPKYCV
jgi:talin